MTGSLSKAGHFVMDVQAAVNGSAVPFVPEQADFGTFTFVSWLRAGAAAGGITAAAGAVRAEVTASFDVVASTGEKLTVNQPIALYGPGDVIGISSDQVIRCEPERGATVAAGGTLAHIEFDDPALPWAFTPTAVSNGALQPWIALVVVPQSAAELSQSANAAPQLLRVGAEHLPTAGDAWAWAHAQVPGAKAASPSLAIRLSDAHGPHNLSRLVCPRRLAPNTAYLACVVPTFDVGVRAGQDLTGGTLGAAWPTSGEVVLPVYYSWTFATGQEADFEELAARLKAVQAPAGIGRRTVDISKPGGRIADTPGARALMKCALYAPAEPPASETGQLKDWLPDRTTALRTEVNRGLATATGPLPRVSPRAYARFQRGLAAMTGSASDWFDQLNTRPVDRIAAGIGTRVVRGDADKLAEAAWNQAGEVEDANVSVIEPAQFGEWVAIGVVKIGEDRMDPGPLVMETHSVHGKVGWGGDRTLAGEIGGSTLPRTATSAAFRRLTAPGGRLSQAIARQGGPAAPFRTLVASPAARGTPAVMGDMRVAFQEPAAIVGLTAELIARVPAARAQAALGAGWQARMGRFTPALDLVGRIPGREVAVDVGQLKAGLRARAVERVVGRGEILSPGVQEALGGELAFAIPAAAPQTARRLQVTLDRFADALPDPAAPQITAAPSVGTTGPLGRGGAINPGKIGATKIDLKKVNLGKIGPAGIDLGGAVFGGSAKAIPAKAAIATAAAMPRVATTSIQRFSALATRRGPTVASATVSAKALRQGIASVFAGRIGGLARTPGRNRPAVTREAILTALSPRRLSSVYMTARLDLPGKLGQWFDDGLLQPLVVDGPRFDRPMYEALLKYDRDWLVPGLGLIKEDQFVTLLVSNARFIESYMVGLSDELSRELLWRGYPSDPRSTAFRRFWSATRDEIDPPIHSWKANQPLGSHFLPPAAGSQPEDRVVLMIRGDLIRKIPHAIVVAQRGLVKPGQSAKFGAPPAAGQKGATLFRAPLANDTLAVGFDLTLQDIAQPGGQPWYFIIAEHPGAPRFGLDLGVKEGVSAIPDELDWSDPPVDVRAGATFLSARTKDAGKPQVPKWGTSSAEHARLLMQSPARVAMEAKALIANIGKAG